MKIFNLEFWKDAGERAVATFLQASLGLVVVDTAAPVWELDWLHIVGVGASAGVMSVAKSLLAGAKNGTPSVGNVEVGKRDRVDDGEVY